MTLRNFFGNGLQRFYILVLILQGAPLFAQNFKTGVHLINGDDKAYTIVYSETNLPSSKICFVEKPSKTRKNGLAPVAIRGDVPGFKILSRKEDKDSFQVETKGVLEPKAEVPCLSLYLNSISIENGMSLQEVKNRTIVIENGRLTRRKRGV
ncbi:hypothetical protein LFX25_11545 [Leptospira sp. FAT2]|uniref:hypothetical protein n=1 Tax=Leptospira sanjuanensis TaxID=2879643 RepID=UPI001EE7C1A5|nr:hypothetical protein [Leptospira sanjuanensis]MCG6193878.1 hypothetical protein [Leptospira sanjuanensis]